MKEEPPVLLLNTVTTGLSKAAISAGRRGIRSRIVSAHASGVGFQDINIATAPNAPLNIEDQQDPKAEADPEKNPQGLILQEKIARILQVRKAKLRIKTGVMPKTRRHLQKILHHKVRTKIMLKKKPGSLQKRKK